eukprot:TRINITY_DN66958_c12_g3_i2.p1 TRINITY_DN66958_c12_g3~~TRINITY_DN66958_c12_g3_i2.p1  ORF type:complete len:611 (-),score=206.85 TRINITY_DN66958_c12_g3_i2:141-1973(-)
MLLLRSLCRCSPWASVTPSRSSTPTALVSRHPFCRSVKAMGAYTIILMILAAATLVRVWLRHRAVVQKLPPAAGLNRVMMWMVYLTLLFGAVEVVPNAVLMWHGDGVVTAPLTAELLWTFAPAIGAIVFVVTADRVGAANTNDLGLGDVPMRARVRHAMPYVVYVLLLYLATLSFILPFEFWFVSNPKGSMQPCDGGERCGWHRFAIATACVRLGALLVAFGALHVQHWNVIRATNVYTGGFKIDGIDNDGESHGRSVPLIVCNAIFAVLCVIVLAVTIGVVDHTPKNEYLNLDPLFVVLLAVELGYGALLSWLAILAMMHASRAMPRLSGGTAAVAVIAYMIFVGMVGPMLRDMLAPTRASWNYHSCHDVGYSSQVVEYDPRICSSIRALAAVAVISLVVLTIVTVYLVYSRWVTRMRRGDARNRILNNADAESAVGVRSKTQLFVRGMLVVAAFGVLVLGASMINESQQADADHLEPESAIDESWHQLATMVLAAVAAMVYFGSTNTESPTPSGVVAMLSLFSAFVLLPPLVTTGHQASDGAMGWDGKRRGPCIAASPNDPMSFCSSYRGEVAGVAFIWIAMVLTTLLTFFAWFRAQVNVQANLLFLQ